MRTADINIDITQMQSYKLHHFMRFVRSSSPINKFYNMMYEIKLRQVVGLLLCNSFVDKLFS